MPVTLKIKNGINHMLKYSRSRNLSFFGHMSDYEYGNIKALGNP